MVSSDSQDLEDCKKHMKYVLLSLYISLGNNEFDDGPELSPFLDNLNTTILASNIIVHADNKHKIQKSIIINKGGVLVGIVGYLTPESKILDRLGNIEYIDEILALKEEVAKLQAQNVKIIIALGHSEQRKCIEIATEVDGIDLVITGHRNSFFWNGTSADTDSVAKNHVIVSQISGKHVPVIESFAYNQYLGKVNLKFDSDGKIIDSQISSLLLDTSIPQDTETSQIMERLTEDITTMSDTIIGNTAVVLDGDSCRLEECNLGNLVADSVMYYYAVRFQGERWTDAPVAIIHGGAIVASISPSNRPAAVTMNNLQTALPAQSNLVIVTMNGVILLQMLEHSVADYRRSNPSGQFLQFSGIRITYDLANNPGSRIVSALVRCWDCIVPEYFAIDSWREYKILMPASLANGEFGYSMLANLPRLNLDYDEVACTSEFMRIRSPVYPDVSGRIVLLNSSAPGLASKLHATGLLFSIIAIYFI